MPYLQASEKGEIIAYRETGGESLSAYLVAGERLIWSDVGYSQETHWIDPSDKVVERPSMSLSISGSTIIGIPAGATLRLGDQTFIVNDGEADIDGYHGSVKFSCWPYLDAEVEI